MITKPTIRLNRRGHHLLWTFYFSNYGMRKPRHGVRLVHGTARWRNAQAIKVHFAVERSIEIAIGGSASSLKKEIEVLVASRPHQ